MSLFRQTTHTNFGCIIEGTVGRFATPAGQVLFFQTRARLSKGGDTSNAGRLTSLLTPAREALEVSEMDFNQLLQRDLDDHRIAHELVPYILKPQLNGPAFFPPILAALLPFEDRRPKNELPGIETHVGTDPQYGEISWKMHSAGEVFRLQEACDANGSLDGTGGAILRWNDERAKLVIMDGQHRAMALLAVHRTLTNSWGACAAASERYKPFYETKIQELWKEVEQNGNTEKLEKLEFPVTICLFLDYSGPGKNPHSAARKLFVDVNKEAKPPSESRLILLSDVRLDHILARELLNKLRTNGTDPLFPLYTVEYDNPDPRISTPRRWNAVTNLEILLRSVLYSCFGPEEVVADVATETKIKGKLPTRMMNSYFRSQMHLQDFLEPLITDGPRTIQRGDIGIEHFPVYNQEARKQIIDQFYKLWGQGILRLLSEIEPYKVHITAARNIKETWGPGGEVTGALAREALFEGVGMFWTLEQGDKHWREQVAKAKALHLTPPPQTEVSKAWQIVDQLKRKEFERERCRLYTGGRTDEEVSACHEFYEVAVTYACQVGLVLTWGLLRHENPGANSESILEAMILCINRSLTTGPNQSRDRRLFFRKSENNPFNLLSKLDSPLAAYFRGFWLELLLLPANREDLASAGIDVDAANGLLQQFRSFYLRRIARDYADSFSRTNGWVPDMCEKEGRKSAIKQLSRAYHHWFGMATEEARDMLEDLLKDAEPLAEEMIEDLPEMASQEDSNVEDRLRNLIKE